VVAAARKITDIPRIFLCVIQSVFRQIALHWCNRFASGERLWVAKAQEKSMILACRVFASHGLLCNFVLIPIGFTVFSRGVERYAIPARKSRSIAIPEPYLAN
jgi:hypothetical protein